MVTEANLIKSDTTYHIVGTIQNLDSRAVDLTIKATLLDSMQQVLTSYYDQYNLTHKLVSKQETAFRIDFEEVSWTLSGTPKRDTSFLSVGHFGDSNYYRSIHKNLVKGIRSKRYCTNWDSCIISAHRPVP